MYKRKYIAKILNILPDKYKNPKNMKIIISHPFHINIIYQTSIIKNGMKYSINKDVWYKDIIYNSCSLYDLINEPKKYIFTYRGFECFMMRLNLFWCGYIDIQKIRYILVNDKNKINKAFVYKLIDCHGGISYINSTFIGFNCNHEYDIVPNIYNKNGEILKRKHINIDELSIKKKTYKDHEFSRNEVQSIVDQLVFLLNLDNKKYIL